LKRFVLLSIAIAVLVVMASFSTAGLGNPLSACLPAYGGVVNKAPGGAFIVEIAFKNTGATGGTWSVNIAFEGESWTWTGLRQTLTLEPNNKKTLTWNGSIPQNASIDSTARLIVYYGDSFMALQWWIHVVPGAELTITSSTVR
jgi:hypothetical protein